VRLFFALNFPPALREALHAAAAPLRAAAPGVRWTHPDRLHLTVKFLGAQPPELEAALRDAMDEIVTRHHAMELVLTGVGAFPNFRRPRVVWIGIEQDPALEQLARDVDTACALLGVPREERPFRPHLTLGRVRPGTRPAALQPLAPVMESLYVHAVASVDTLDLMESRADHDGHRYIVLHRAALSAR
jgi:2'-5' RNA ligase